MGNYNQTYNYNSVLGNHLFNNGYYSSNIFSSYYITATGDISYLNIRIGHETLLLNIMSGMN